jgi:hypothetical protein
MDAIDDRVEQVSSAMLAASVSFGVQLLLLHPGASMLVSALLAASALAFAALWRRTPYRTREFAQGTMKNTAGHEKALER